MSKIITGQTIYDDFISACWNDNGALYYENQYSSTKPTYSQVMNGLMGGTSDDKFNSFRYHYRCSTTDPTKCAICSNDAETYIDTESIVGYIFNSSVIDWTGDPYPYITPPGEFHKAITTTEFNGSDIKFSNKFDLAKLYLGSEIGGIFTFPGYCDSASLTIKADMGGGMGWQTIARIDDLGDKEYMECDYNPIIILPAGTIGGYCTAQYELKFPGEASAISVVQNGLPESYIRIEKPNHVSYTIPAKSARYSGYDLYVTFETEVAEFQLQDILDIYDLDIHVEQASTAKGTASVYLGQWEKTTTPANPNSSSYAGVYRSASNYNIDNETATMTITINNCSTFKMYIRSYAEGNYDYVMVSQLDKTITGSTSYSDTTLVKAHTRGNQQSGTAISNYTTVEFTGISSGLHTITVVYRKDTSRSDNDDRGYVLIDKSNVTVTEISQTPSGYGSIYIPWSECFVRTWSGSIIYLNSSSFYGMTNTTYEAECFGVNDYYGDFRVELTSNQGAGFTVSAIDNYNPYTYYGNQTIYIKVPVSFYPSGKGTGYSYLFVPVAVGLSGFTKAHNSTECAISPFGQPTFASGGSTSNYIMFEPHHNTGVQGIGDWLAFYNGLVWPSCSVAFYDEMYTGESIAIHNTNTLYNAHGPIYGTFANSSFTTYQDQGQQLYDMNLVWNNNTNYKYNAIRSASYNKQNFSIIPDKYYSTNFTIDHLLLFWYDLAYNYSDLFLLSMVPVPV